MVPRAPTLLLLPPIRLGKSLTFQVYSFLICDSVISEGLLLIHLRGHLV